MARLQEMKMFGGSKMLLALALLAGLVAAVIVFVVLSDNNDSQGATTASSEAPAVVAARQITAGTEITDDMVKVSDVPDDLLVVGALDSTDVVVGETARVTIAQGEQITSSDLGVAVPDQGISGVIPVGMRGVGVEVDEVTAVGGLLLPGDRIDIVRTLKIKGVAGLGENEYILRTETMLQNVEVLSVAQESQEASAQASADGDTTNPSTTSGQLPDDVEEQPNAATITVALDPAQAQVVVGSQDSEAVIRVWAIQRAFGDSQNATVPAFEERIID